MSSRVTGKHEVISIITYDVPGILSGDSFCFATERVTETHKMTDSSQHPPAVRTGRQFSLGELLRSPAGAAGVVAVVAYVHRLHADVYYVFGTKFTVTTLLSALVGYLVCRCFLGRFTSLLAGMASAGMAGSFLWCCKGDGMRKFAILGMLVACSLFIAFGWIDRGRVPFLKRTGPSSGSSTD